MNRRPTCEEATAGTGGEPLVQIGLPTGSRSTGFEATRRDVLSLMGFSLGAIGLGGCRAPVQHAVPLPAASTEMVPGVPNLYATTCGGCAASCGLVVKQRDGRPIKIEGNDASPLTGGGTCAAGQASVLSLYDDALGLMYADAALSPDDVDAWRDRWEGLSGGAYLMDKLGVVIDQGALLPEDAGEAEREALRTRLGWGAAGRLELAENVLVKLCAALLREELDHDAFKATLLCPYFRLNVHRNEVHQLLVLYERFAQADEFHYQSESLETARRWAGMTLELLAQPAPDIRTHPEAFEVRETEPPVVEDDWLVVQEFAVTRPGLFEAVRTLVGQGEG